MTKKLTPIDQPRSADEILRDLDVVQDVADQKTAENNALLLDFALTKLLAKKTKTFDLEPGSYRIRGTATVKIDATITRRKDSSYTPTADIPLLPTMAILLHRMGVTRNAARELIVEAATEALTAGGKVGDHLTEYFEGLEGAVANLKADLKKRLPVATRLGAKSVSGTIDVRSMEMIDVQKDE